MTLKCFSRLEKARGSSAEPEPTYCEYSRIFPKFCLRFSRQSLPVALDDELSLFVLSIKERAQVRKLSVFGQLLQQQQVKIEAKVLEKVLRVLRFF
jgi:hypothetical protein